MNPNSDHQMWSLWVYEISGATKGQFFNDVVRNCARFGTKAFGHAAQMRVLQYQSHWEVRIMAEGYPVHDDKFVAWMHEQWRNFLLKGFGYSSVVAASAKLLAGRPQDGRPADQLIIMPTLTMSVSE
jgi:hypothetical protein